MQTLKPRSCESELTAAFCFNTAKFMLTIVRGIMSFAADIRLWRTSADGREEAVIGLHLLYMNPTPMYTLFSINVVLEINVDLTQSRLDQEM